MHSLDEVGEMNKLLKTCFDIRGYCEALLSHCREIWIQAPGGCRGIYILDSLLLTTREGESALSNYLQ
jgi:hypothetical protein